jgi:8-oxo-dGTP diphosphatase
MPSPGKPSAEADLPAPVPVDVAVAVLLRADGATLLAQRPRGRVYAGYWEFPGGKVEEGEPVAEALKREIREELGVEIENSFPWMTRVFTYPHARVRLHFCRVYSWLGEPRALEHADLAWQHPDAITVNPLLPANGPIVRGLQLPAEYGITRGGELGVEPFLALLEARLHTGLRQVQIREKTLEESSLEEFSRRVVALSHSHGARVLVNSDVALARRVGADGVHLTAAQLRATPLRPKLPWCGASCHSSEELRRAELLGADFAVLGPVQVTPSHPGAGPLGWQKFREIVDGAAIPVYALGGMKRENLDLAMHCGAHGIAMVRGSWQ